MNYDKNSFLAGISVGMTMKGWAGGGGNFGNSGGTILAGTFPIREKWQGAIVSAPIIEVGSFGGESE